MEWQERYGNSLKVWLWRLSLCWLLGSYPATMWAQGLVKGVGVAVNDEQGRPAQTLQLYEGSYALLIGASDYGRMGWPKLPEVRDDLKAVREALERKHGFVVEEILNPTRLQLLTALEAFVTKYGLANGNRLLLYFSGHGYTEIDPNDQRKFGYFVPVDAPLPARDLAGFQAKAVTMDEIENYARRIRSKHALFLFDSCFSGTLINKSTPTAPKYITYLTTQPVRQFITAGADNQEVPAESVFRQVLVEALTNQPNAQGKRADTNQDGYLTGTELAAYLLENVIYYRGDAQTPQYGKIRDPKLDKGDFVFVINAPVARPDNPLPDASLISSVTRARQTQLANLGPEGNSVKGDTRQAYTLLQQKKYQAALTEARRITTQFPTDPEAWKISGFAQLSLKQYAAAANDLQKASDLLHATTDKEDPYISDALAQAYFFSEQYAQALPLLTAATNRATPEADAALLFYRGVTEYRLGKNADAEKTFIEVVKANPKDTGALYFLGQFAYEHNELPAAINWLNRVTVNDPNATDAWRLLTSAYLRRASIADDTTQAETDYLAATRAGEQLARLSQDTDDSLLYGQSLIGSAQYAKAIPILERAAATKKGDGQIMFMLGAAHLRAKNYVKAATAFEQAAKLTPAEVNIYRELGYAYEAQRLYAKALAAYQKGLSLAPGDSYFQEGVTRVKPFAK